MESALVKLLGIILASGVAGSFVAAIVVFFSRDQRLRLGNTTGIGFLIGAAIGATFGVFWSITARL